MLTPVAIPRFAGLQLLADPQEAGMAAVDLLNVDLDRDGRVRSRDGYAKFTSSANADRIIDVFPFYKTDGTSYLLAGTDFSTAAKLTVYNTSGASATSVTDVMAGGPIAGWSFSRIGTTSTELVYFSAFVEGSTASLYKFDGTTITTVGSAAGAYFLAAQAADNRLVYGRYLANPSRVQFSNAGAPETLGANNYVDLMPGDGERITNLVPFGAYVIAFKASKFFVFYGTSVDGTGNPIFNYRAVETGVGCASSRGAVSTPRGVYFVDRRGIYLTAGGAPKLVSRSIDPVFLGGASGYFQSSSLNLAQIAKAALTWHNERLYFAFPSGSATVNDRVAVLDPNTGFWVLHDLPAGSMCPFRVASTPELMFAYASGTKDVGRHSSSYTTDAGSGISSRYRTGFWNPGQAGTEAWVREVLLDGTGTVTVKTAVNDNATLGTGQAVTLGTSPAVAQGRDRRGLRGRNVSYEFSGTAPWSLSRVTPIVWGQRSPGEQAA